MHARNTQGFRLPVVTTQRRVWHASEGGASASRDGVFRRPTDAIRHMEELVADSDVRVNSGGGADIANRVLGAGMPLDFCHRFAVRIAAAANPQYTRYDKE